RAMEQRLDGICIGFFRLRVKLARSRDSGGRAATTSRKGRSHSCDPPTRRRIGVSFAEVVHGEKSPVSSEMQQKQKDILPGKIMEPPKHKIVFQQEESGLEWLKDCLVGECFSFE
ncbi:hypothetical protein Ancab_025191, partial [Ancistrocladus abbreviatus]